MGLSDLSCGGGRVIRRQLRLTLEGEDMKINITKYTDRFDELGMPINNYVISFGSPVIKLGLTEKEAMELKDALTFALMEGEYEKSN